MTIDLFNGQTTMHSTKKHNKKNMHNQQHKHEIYRNRFEWVVFPSIQCPQNARQPANAYHSHTHCTHTYKHTHTRDIEFKSEIENTKQHFVEQCWYCCMQCTWQTQKKCIFFLSLSGVFSLFHSWCAFEQPSVIIFDLVRLHYYMKIRYFQLIPLSRSLFADKFHLIVRW